MSLSKKFKMAFAAAITAGMMFTGAGSVSAAPASSLGQSAGAVQDLLGSDVQEVRSYRGGGGYRGVRSGGYRGGYRMGYRSGYRGYRHRHYRGGYWRGVGFYGGGYCVRRVGWHYNAFGEYVFGPYRRCY